MRRTRASSPASWRRRSPVCSYVEFPRGPLAIGDDYQIVPVTRSTAAGRALVLSATDSCRDRPAAFYHWNDRQSLDVAVSIARRNRIDAIAIWKFSKNQEPAKEFIEFLFRKENYDAWVVASNAFNQPPLRDLADHPIWAKNPKFAMLPKEAEYAHARGWPSKPNDAVRRIENNYVLPDMVSKSIQGMPVKRVMEWGQDQVVQAVKGQLKASG